jgi:hypothetical protein
VSFFKAAPGLAALAAMLVAPRGALAEEAVEPAATSSEARHVLVVPPPGWTAQELAPPDLSQAPQVTLVQWEAWGPGGDPRKRLVAACFTVVAATWTDELQPIALAKVVALASSTALAITSVGTLRPRSTSHARNVLDQRLEGAGEAEGQLAARILLGFEAGTPPRLAGCYLLCTLGECDTSIDRAIAPGPYVPPPAPSLALRAVVALVHHPLAATWTLLGLSCLLVTIAVVTRKRPRAK